MVIGKVAIGRAIFKHQNEQFFLIQLYFHNNLDEGDVENTTIDKDDIVIDKIEFINHVSASDHQHRPSLQSNS